MTDAPERIWAATPLDGLMKPETMYGWTTAEHLPEWQSENEAEIELGCDDPLGYVEYIRLDLHEAAVAAARAEGMREAWQIAHNRWVHWANKADRLFEMDGEYIHQSARTAEAVAREANNIASLLFAEASK